MGVVVLSTLVFILSTMPELTDDIDMILFTNTTDVKEGLQPVERWDEVSEWCEDHCSVICISISKQFTIH